MILFPSFGDTKIEEVFGKPHRKAAEITIAYVSTSFLDSFLASGLTPKYQFFGEAFAM